MAIPHDQAGLSSVWLASVLDGWDATAHITVERIGAERGIGGWLFRVRQVAGGRSVVVELPIEQDPWSLGGVQQEVEIYQRLGARLAIDVPMMLHGACDTDAAVLVLEDLGSLRQGDDVAGCDLDDAHRSLEALGPRRVGSCAVDAGAPGLPARQHLLRADGPSTGVTAITADALDPAASFRVAYLYWLTYAVVVLGSVPMGPGPTRVVETWIRRLVLTILRSGALER